MYRNVRGLVLREVKYKESSKMLTVLTAEGKLSVEGRGALRKGSHIGGSAQQFTLSDMTLFENRGRHLLTEGAVVEDFSAIRDRVEDFALAAYIAELLDTVSMEGNADEAVMNLGLNTLFALSRQLYPARHIKAVFELRLLCLAGFAPELEYCPHCGRGEIDTPRLSLQGGAVHCIGCPPAAPGRSAVLCGASLAAMRHVVHASSKKIFSFTLEERAAERFYAACEDYALTQLDRGFATLEYWKSIMKSIERSEELAKTVRKPAAKPENAAASGNQSAAAGENRDKAAEQTDAGSGNHSAAELSAAENENRTARAKQPDAPIE